MHNTAWENGQRVPIVEFNAPSFDVPIMRRDSIGLAPVPPIEIDHAVFQRLTKWVAGARTARQFALRKAAVEWMAWPEQSAQRFAAGRKKLNRSQFARTIQQLRRAFKVQPIGSPAFRP